MRERVTASVADIDDCSPAFLDEVARAPGSAHADFMRAPCLNTIEVSDPPPARSFAGPLRIAAWNLERGKHAEAAGRLLRRLGVDVALLSEMDVGMARSRNRHTVRTIAAELAAAYAFGVEFVELGLGIGRELVDHAGQRNARSLHGNAVVTTRPIRDAFILPVEERGLWFDLDWHHRRLGGRNGVGAMVDAGGQRLVVVSTHFENHSTPADRVEQMGHLLRGLDAAADRGVPVVIAGDLNTTAFPAEAGTDDGWFAHPASLEPLFALMEGAGFDWRSANTPGQTRRRIDDGRPPMAMRKVDWIFTRGLRAANAQVHPALDERGVTLSDHELLTIDVAFPD